LENDQSKTPKPDENRNLLKRTITPPPLPVKQQKRDTPPLVAGGKRATTSSPKAPPPEPPPVSAEQVMELKTQLASLIRRPRLGEFIYLNTFLCHIVYSGFSKFPISKDEIKYQLLNLIGNLMQKCYFSQTCYKLFLIDFISKRNIRVSVYGNIVEHNTRIPYLHSHILKNISQTTNRCWAC